MKLPENPLRAIGSTVFGSLFLGLVLGVLSAGTAGAISDDEDRLFRFAGHDKDNGTVRQLLAEGISPNAAGNFDGRTAVHSAAKGGAAKNLAAMLQAGGNPKVQDGDGDTPLHLASRGSYVGGFSDHSAAVQVLLQHGANLHRTNNSGETPLHVAVFTGAGAAHVFVIKALLDAGARPSAVDGNGLTVLQRFTRHSENNGPIVRLLLQAGADPDQKDPQGDVPLHAAIKSGGSYGKAEVVEALLDGGANPCVRDDRGYTPYHLADSRGMTRSRQALDRVQGFDASHAGGQGCSGDDAQPTDRVEADQGNDDSSEMAVVVTEPKCDDNTTNAGFSENGCWIEVADRPNCHVWTIYWGNGFTILSWSGACVGGVGQGAGSLDWGRGSSSSPVVITGSGSLVAGKFEGQWVWDWTHWEETHEGPYVHGKRHGEWVEWTGAVDKGLYVDGKKHGRWVKRSGARLVEEIDYENGNPVGGYDHLYGRELRF